MTFLGGGGTVGLDGRRQIRVDFSRENGFLRTRHQCEVPGRMGSISLCRINLEFSRSDLQSACYGSRNSNSKESTVDRDFGKVVGKVEISK